MGKSTFSDAWVFIVPSVLLCLLFHFLFTKRRRRRREEEEEASPSSEGFVVPRGSRGWPLIGETLDFIACGYSSKPVSFMEKRKSLYGDVFRTHILGKAIVVSCDPAVNKMIMQNHGSVFVPCYPKSITELLGKSSILQMNGSAHKRIHSLIGSFLKSPQFKARIARDIQTAVRLSLSSWPDKPGPVYVQDETKKITFEILVRVLLSIDSGEEIDLLKKEFEEFIKGLICVPINLPGTTLYKSLKAKKRLIDEVNKVIGKRRMAMEKAELDQNRWPNDVVDVLLNDTEESEKKKRVEYIGENIIEMMIPGEETVPTAMTLAVKFLGDNPDALARLVEENLVLRRRKDNSCEEYSWADYMSLAFTQDIISETLRLANIINAIWRKALKDVEIKGYLIPKGWCVLASFSSVHMDETNYENPYQFDPWRWKGIGAGVSSNIFTPFGGGQRLCPGLELSRLEISIFLHHLVTTYKWAAEKDEIIYFPTVKMRRKLPVAVTPLHEHQL